MYTRKLKKGDEVKEYYGYEFNTFTFRSFNWIYEMFYNKGKKVISLKIEKYLTPLALAVWIMDDGGWAKPGTRIATNSFKLEEVEFLASVLRKNFDLDCTVQKNRNYWSIFYLHQRFIYSSLKKTSFTLSTSIYALQSRT